MFTELSVTDIANWLTLADGLRHSTSAYIYCSTLSVQMTPFTSHLDHLMVRKQWPTPLRHLYFSKVSEPSVLLQAQWPRLIYGNESKKWFSLT